MKFPAVAARVVLSVDGKIVTRTKGAAWGSAAPDREGLVKLRGGVDAILVGDGTLDAEDSPLRLSSARWRGERVRAGKSEEPLRVIISDSGRIRKSLRVFRKGGGPVVVFTTGLIPASTKRWLEKVARLHVGARAKTVDLRQALLVLARDYGVRSVLCEGGADVFRAMVEGGLLQTLHVSFAPLILGGANAPTLLGPAGSALLKRSIPLRLEGFSPRGGGAHAVYRMAAGSKLRH
jgi:riboflavin-specific deaminase-like protein